MDSVPEVWKAVKDYEGQFEVSNQGRVRSLDRVVLCSDGRTQRWRGKNLRPGRSETGYYTVTFGGRSQSVHALVASAFIAERPPNSVVNHINGVKTDNCVENLEYCSQVENVKHACRTGLLNNRGERHGLATTTREQVDTAYALYSEGTMLVKDIARVVGCSRGVVQLIARGKRWGLPPLPYRNNRSTP